MLLFMINFKDCHIILLITDAFQYQLVNVQKKSLHRLKKRLFDINKYIKQLRNIEAGANILGIDMKYLTFFTIK